MPRQEHRGHNPDTSCVTPSKGLSTDGRFLFNANGCESEGDACHKSYHYGFDTEYAGLPSDLLTNAVSNR